MEVIDLSRDPGTAEERAEIRRDAERPGDVVLMSVKGPRKREGLLGDSSTVIDVELEFARTSARDPRVRPPPLAAASAAAGPSGRAPPKADEPTQPSPSVQRRAPSTAAAATAASSSAGQRRPPTAAATPVSSPHENLRTPQAETLSCCLVSSSRCSRLRDAAGRVVGVACAAKHFVCAACLEKGVRESPEWRGRALSCEACTLGGGVRAPYSDSALSALVDAAAAPPSATRRLLLTVPLESLEGAWVARIFFDDLSGAAFRDANTLLKIEAVNNPRLWGEYEHRRRVTAVRGRGGGAYVHL